jgi:putative transcriptional regulator
MVRKQRNEYFEGIKDGMLDVLGALKNGRKLTRRNITLPSSLEKMSACDIADLRENKLQMSQHMFALTLNVSPKTIQAWEQNINTPGGAALRLLWMLKKEPGLSKTMFPAQVEHSGN